MVSNGWMSIAIFCLMMVTTVPVSMFDTLFCSFLHHDTCVGTEQHNTFVIEDKRVPDR